MIEIENVTDKTDHIRSPQRLPKNLFQIVTRH